MHRADVGIVEIARMGVSAVDERRPRGIEPLARQQDARFAAAAEFELELAGGSAPRQARTDCAHAQEIEHQRFHALDDFVRRVLQAESRRPFGEYRGRSPGCRYSHFSPLLFLISGAMRPFHTDTPAVRAANTLFHSTFAVVCINTNKVATAPIVIASPVSPLKKNA